MNTARYRVSQTADALAAAIASEVESVEFSGEYSAITCPLGRGSNCLTIQIGEQTLPLNSAMAKAAATFAILEELAVADASLYQEARRAATLIANDEEVSVRELPAALVALAALSFL